MANTRFARASSHSIEFTTPRLGTAGCAAADAGASNQSGGVYNAVMGYSYSDWLSGGYMASQVVWYVSQSFVMLFAIVSAWMRLRRGGSESTGHMRMLPVLPWIYGWLNWAGQKVIGCDIIPKVRGATLSEARPAQNDPLPAQLAVLTASSRTSPCTN